MKQRLSLLIFLFALLFGGYSVVWPALISRAQRNAGNSSFSADSSESYRDPVTRLQQRIDRGEVKLEYAEPGGWLQSVLKNLRVPVSSQSLVFSRTSLQSGHISPENPRAIYFNDDVYVGWIRGAELIEVAAVDPVIGGIYFTIEQRPDAPARFTRNETCMRCHVSPNTKFMPGHFVRSVLPEGVIEGVTNLGTFITDHTSPFDERWGGWYVTGTHGGMRHLGNLPVVAADLFSNPEKMSGGNLTSLTKLTNLRGYASTHSDIVALMTLAHQTQMQNLMVWVGYETHIAQQQQKELHRASGKITSEMRESSQRRIHFAVDELLRYMLFVNEAKLESAVKGTSGFAEEFVVTGPRDKQGRSLRDFDLKQRLFRYPCSYQIYSDAFDAMPPPALEYLYQRLWLILTEKDQDKAFATLTRADRRAILEILRETKKNLPEYFYANESAASR